MSNQAPIGIFDSGIGGLTVAHAIQKFLPGEQLIYFGDTAHLPYGDKAPSSIIDYSKRIASFLIDKGCKMIVIACNTASSIAFEEVQKIAGDVPVINVIDPVVEVVDASKYHNIGVIGTRATINSGEYEKRIKKRDAAIVVSSMATPLLVPFIEEHIMDDEIGQLIIKKYLSQVSLKNIDALILGCTHYPLLKKNIELYYSGKVEVFDSANIVGEKVRDFLLVNELACEKKIGEHAFFVSDFTPSFEKNTRNFFGEKIHLEEIDLWRSLKPGTV